LEARIAGHHKGIRGLSQSIPGANEEKRQLRAKQLEEKHASLAAAQRELEEVALRSPELLALKECERRWHEFLFERSEMGAAMNNLATYNASVASIRSGSIGKEGLQFEHECLQIVERFFNPANDPAIRVLRSVKLRGVQFPEFATSEFDYWVVRGDEVLFVTEMKRSTGAVRGNLTKKMSSMAYLLSDAFGGTVYEGLNLTSKSFARFRDDGFFDNMYFFAREPVTVRDDEDVFAMFMDNDDAFLTALMDVPQQLGTPEFLQEACELSFRTFCSHFSFSVAYVKSKYPMDAEDMEDYRRGSAAFLTSVQRGRVVLVKHVLQAQAFGLPLRHKSTVLTK
jgi:hypothetical protein